MSQNGKSSRGMDFPPTPREFSSKIQHVAPSTGRNAPRESSLDFLISQDETKPNRKQPTKSRATDKKPRLKRSHRNVCLPLLTPPGKPEDLGSLCQEGPSDRQTLASCVETAMSPSGSLGTRCSAVDSSCKSKCSVCCRGREGLLI